MLHDPRMLRACALVVGVSAVALVLLLPIGSRLGLVDRPDHIRKRHAFDTPLVGGLAVTAGILAGWWYLGRFHAFEDAVIGTSLGLVLVGVIDDLCDLKVRVRLVAQLFAIAVVILATGVYVHSLGILHGHDIELGWLGIPFTVVAVIGLLNAFNLIDGIDGLAGCMALVAAGAICLLGNPGTGNPAITLVVMAAAAVLPFLAFNLGLFGRQGKVFLGDSGSIVLGYLFAWTLIGMSQSEPRQISPGLVLWCVALPVFDTLTVMFRRLCRGKSPFTAGRGHIHHLLLDAGLSPRTALLCLVAFAAVLPFLGLEVHRRAGPAANLAAFVLLLVLYAAGTTYLWQRREQKLRAAPRHAAAADGNFHPGLPAAHWHRPAVEGLQRDFSMQGPIDGALERPEPETRRSLSESS